MRWLSKMGDAREATAYLWAAVIGVLFGLGIAMSAGATPGDILYVQANGVDVRAAPSANARVLMQLDRDHQLMEFERRGSWVRVGLHYVLGRDGWVHGSHLAPRPPGETGVAPPNADLERSGTTDDQSRVTVPSETVAEFLIDVSGSPALAFRADCRIVTETGEVVRRKVRGLIPKRYTVEAEAVSCIVQKRDALGRLRVKLMEGDDIVARAETAAAFNWVRVRSDGPWGKAKGVRGATRVFSLRPSPGQGLVPTLDDPARRGSGDPVPPFSSDPVPSFSSDPVPSFSSDPVPSFSGN